MEREGQERDLAGVQVVVRDREVVQEEGFRGELLRGEPFDGDQALPGAEIHCAQREAALRGLQFGPRGLGRLRLPLDRRHGPGLPLPRRDQAQEDGHHRRELGAHR